MGAGDQSQGTLSVQEKVSLNSNGNSGSVAEASAASYYYKKVVTYKKVAYYKHHKKYYKYKKVVTYKKVYYKTAKAASVSKTTTTTYSISSSSSTAQILASGAKYGYSSSAHTGAAMVSSGSGDCWAMSDYLYSKLEAAGINARIVQYSTAYSSRHRSVQLYQSGSWVDVPYSSYGYNSMFRATSSKPGMTVVAS
jgi:hypothetical protein